MKLGRAGILVGLSVLTGAGILLLRQNGSGSGENDRLSPVSEIAADAAQAPPTITSPVQGRQPDSGEQEAPAAAAVKDEITQTDAAPIPMESDPKQRIFPGHQLITREDSAPDSEGVVTRIELIQTKFKYPLIRVVEKWQKDPKTGKLIIVDQLMMVADHLLVQKTDGMSDAAFRDLIRSTGAGIRREGGEGPYLISFDGRDLHALEKKREEILKAGGGAILVDYDNVRTLR